MAACRTALYLVDEFNSETVRTPVIVRTALHRMHTDPSRQKEPWALLASGCRQSLHAPTIVAIYRVNLCWSPSPSHSLDIWEHCPHCVSSVTQTYLYIIFVGTLHRSLVTNTSYTLSFCMLPSRDLLKRTMLKHYVTERYFYCTTHICIVPSHTCFSFFVWKYNAYFERNIPVIC